MPPEAANKTSPEKRIFLRWRYIILPVAILLVSAILAISFYGLLPPEVAYHFKDGSPDRWIGRSAIIAWLIIPQFVFVLVGLAIISAATILGTRSLQAENASVRKLVLIMGNMVALPQIILTFAMFDIFLYNAYQIHLMPLWLFALIVMVLGGIILGIFFIQSFGQFHGDTVKISRSDRNDGTDGR